MRRLIAPCACILALITGAWFGQAYALYSEPDPIAVTDPSAKRAEETVWRFYDAIDYLISTGDDRALRAVVAPEFVDNTNQPDSTADREGLIRHIASLRETHPSLRLVPQDILIQDGRAVTRLSVAGTKDGALLGIPLRGTAPWPHIDIVRVHQDQIIERWGEPTGYAASTALFSESLTITQGGRMVPVLQRLTYDPGATDEASVQHGPAIISVESGSLDVIVKGGPGVIYQPADLAGSGGYPPRWPASTVGPGDIIVVPDGVAFATNNPSDAPAVALLFSLIQPLPTQGAVRPRDANGDGKLPRMTVRTLAGHSLAIAGPVEITADLTRVSLAPGTRLGPHLVSALELVVVETGTLTAIIDGHPVNAWLRDAGGRSITPPPLSTIGEGFGLTIGKDARTSYHNESTQPATLLSLKLAST